MIFVRMTGGRRSIDNALKVFFFFYYTVEPVHAQLKLALFHYQVNYIFNAANCNEYLTFPLDVLIYVKIS